MSPRLHHCLFCGDCIDREIVQTLRIKEVLSNPANGELERQRLMELLRERQRLLDEAEKIGKEIL